MSEVSKKVKNGITQMICGREDHVDGGIHFHVCFEAAKKLDIRDARHFDLKSFDGKWYHPNVKSVSGRKDNFFTVVEYCMKHGDHASHNLSLFPNSKNFRNRLNDHEAWKQYCLNQHLTDVKWPITLPDGTQMAQPTAADRNRHKWIWGAPGVGKTRWVQEQFKGQRVYNTTSGDFAFDNYSDEDVIIWDDCPLDLTHKPWITHIANVNTSSVQMPRTRYRQKSWKCNQVRVMLVLANNPPDAALLAEEWFTQRFTVIQMLPMPPPAARPVVLLSRPPSSSRSSSSSSSSSSATSYPNLRGWNVPEDRDQHPSFRRERPPYRDSNPHAVPNAVPSFRPASTLLEEHKRGAK